MPGKFQIAMRKPGSAADFLSSMLVRGDPGISDHVVTPVTTIDCIRISDMISASLIFELTYISVDNANGLCTELLRFAAGPWVLARVSGVSRPLSERSGDSSSPYRLAVESTAGRAWCLAQHHLCAFDRRSGISPLEVHGHEEFR
jgi:hypothetical protein